MLFRKLIIVYSENNTQLGRNSDGLRAGRPEFDFRQEQDFFLWLLTSSPAVGPTHNGYRRLSLRG
jgi:hypothetical protein